MEWWCNACGQEFNRKANLEKHWLHSHDGCREEIDLKDIQMLDSSEIEDKTFDADYKSNIDTIKCKPTVQHVCDICDKVLKTRVGLKVHRNNVHSDEKKFLCDICNMAFPSKERIRAHMITHISSKSHRCKHCSNIYTYKESLWRHMLKHFDKETISAMRSREVTRKPIPKCDRCNIIFKSHYSVKRHIARVHDDVRKFSCDVCGKRFGGKYNLISHLIVHTSDKLHRCELCDTSFKRIQTLNKHMQSHSKTYNRYTHCEICSKEILKRSLQQHMLVHIKSENAYTCDVCNKTYKTRSSLSDHQKRHNSVKQFKCQICQVEFWTVTSLKVHAQVHAKEKPFQCSICHKRYSYMTSLNQHKRSHNGVKPHACTICEKRFAMRNTLNNHMLHHYEASPYLCDVCGKSFRRKNSVRQHMQQHTGICEYSCELCRLDFALSVEASTHKKAHSYGFQFICNTCGRGYALKGSLVDHVSTHRDVKHPCGVCGEKFISKPQLHYHVKDVHWKLLLR